MYDLALRYATARRRIEILSSFDTMLFSNGRIDARWSSASLNLCLYTTVPIWLQMTKNIYKTRDNFLSTNETETEKSNMCCC